MILVVCYKNLILGFIITQSKQHACLFKILTLTNNIDSTVIFVTAQDSLLGQKVCNDDNITLASATICSLDQFDRPVIGIINFCLDALDVYETSSISSEYYSTTDAVEIATHQIGHLLGMNSEMFKYFRNPSTGAVSVYFYHDIPKNVLIMSAVDL